MLSKIKAVVLEKPTLALRDGRGSGDATMQTLKIDERLWSSGMLPEGILEQWHVVDQEEVVDGQLLASVRIEDALHDIVAPAGGRIALAVPAASLIEPGSMIAMIGPAVATP